MKSLFFNLILIGLSVLTSSAQINKVPQITYNDSAYIKIIVSNIIDTLNFQTKCYPFFPHSASGEKKIVIVKPGIYYLAYQMTKPEMVHFDIEVDFAPVIVSGDTMVIKEGIKLDQNLDAGVYFQSLIIPKDTLVVNVGFNTNEKENPTIYGTANGNINDYYQHKKQILGYYSFLDHDFKGIDRFYKNEISRSEYNEAIDIINYSVEQNILFLDKNKKNLPNWFYYMEKSDIIYGAARITEGLFDKLNSIDQKRATVVSVEFNNPSVLLSSFYYSFLEEYMYYRFFTAENIKKNMDNFKINFFIFKSNIVDSLLSGEIKDYFITCELADLYTNNRKYEDVKKVDSFIVKNYPKLTEDKIQYINSVKKRFAKFIKSELTKGDNAPGFYLRDMNAVQYQLTNFTDKFVYLHFWSTLNETSMNDISAFNKLFSQIGDKPIEIVHICMDDNPEKIKQIIEKYNLKGVNLICKGNWGKTLKSSYFIEEFPHYVLIDKNGIIIQNKCKGPSNIYSDFIQILGN